MKAIIQSNGNKIAYGVKKLTVDSDADLQNLNVRILTVGTTVFSIESSKYFMLNSKKEWKEINPSGSNIFNPATLDLDGGSIDK